MSVRRLFNYALKGSQLSLLNSIDSEAPEILLIMRSDRSRSLLFESV